LASGKLVFADSVPKDNEAATWREKLDQLYKSSSQSFRVVVHGSKVCISFLYVGALTFTCHMYMFVYLYIIGI